MHMQVDMDADATRAQGICALQSSSFSWILLYYFLFMQDANAEVERVEKRGANVIFYFQSVS
jgi:predicted enzyme related to lactoylglutathione lyase